MRSGLVPGVNVDRVDVAAGIAQARGLGYAAPEELMVIEYALMRHARGEEDGAERTIISHRIDFTSWRMILAAAVAASERRSAAAEALKARGVSLDPDRSFTLDQIESLAGVVKKWED